MAEIYIYESDATDLGSIGLCGCLFPTSCEFEDVANGLSSITLEHPFDAWGKFRFLQADRILSVEVPVRTTSEIENGDFVTNVETWKVLPTATRSQRTIYNSKNGDKKVKLVKINEQVTVVKNNQYIDRYKVKYKKWSGWMPKDGLQKLSETVIPDTPAGIEQVAPSWKVKPQYFRITSVELSESGGVIVHAQHIFYDLLYTLTDYKTSGNYSLQTALDGVLSQTLSTHDFAAETNISGTHTGFNAKDLDPVTAVLDPSVGLCQDWDAELVRDNYDFFLLAQAGFDRGTTIEYAKNLSGVTMTTDMSNVCTSIRPIGEDKDGKPLYLSTDNYPDGCINSTHINDYAFRRTMRLQVPEAKVDGEDVKVADARRMLKAEAEKQFSEYQVDMPTVSTSIEFAELGDDPRYAQYKDLDKVYLYDIVSVRHEELGIAVASQVVRIVYDCLLESVKTVELGSLQQLMPSISGFQISGGISGSKLLPGSVGGGQIGNGAIVATHIQADSINTNHLQAGSITAGKIAAGAITADKMSATVGEFQNLIARDALIDTANIKEAAIKSAQIDDAAITSAKIHDAAITTAKIADAAITSAKIKDGEITSAKIGTGEITSALIEDAAITTAKINDAAITTAKIKDGEITSAKIGTGEIKTANIENAAITAAKIIDGEIGSAKIADAAIVSAKIDEGAITSVKIANEAVVTTKIADGAITTAKIGTAQITSALIANGTITAANIADATITSAKIASIDGDKIIANTIVADKLIIRGNDGLYYKLNYLASQDAGSTITAEQLATDEFKKHLHGENIVAQSITAGQIAAGTITANEIHSGTITATQIASGTITTTQLSSEVGSSLVLTSNESVQTMITDADDALKVLINTNANGISTLISDSENMSQSIDATAKGLSVVQTWQNENQGTVENVAGYMDFTGGELTIGKSDSPFQMKLSNSELGFYQAKAKVAYMDTSKLFIENGEILTDLRIGNYLFTPQTNGHMSLVYSKK